MRHDDPVRKTLVRVALLTLVPGFAAGAALAFVPRVPLLFALGVPAICMMMAANLYALSNRPRGEYTHRVLHAFRPPKPVDGAGALEGGRSDDKTKP